MYYEKCGLKAINKGDYTVIRDYNNRVISTFSGYGHFQYAKSEIDHIVKTHAEKTANRMYDTRGIRE